MGDKCFLHGWGGVGVWMWLGFCWRGGYWWGCDSLRLCGVALVDSIVLIKGARWEGLGVCGFC